MFVGWGIPLPEPRPVLLDSRQYDAESRLSAHHAPVSFGDAQEIAEGLVNFTAKFRCPYYHLSHHAFPPKLTKSSSSSKSAHVLISSRLLLNLPAYSVKNRKVSA